MTGAELERLAREQRPRLLAFARSRARSPEDAEDAVQHALTVAFAVRERIEPTTAVTYVGVIARHEAIRLGERAQRDRSLDGRQARPESTGLHETLADRRHTDIDRVIDVLDRLRDVKADHARALMARALGWRYHEICDAFGWSYTKTNRCVTEGRAAVRNAAAA